MRGKWQTRIVSADIDSTRRVSATDVPAATPVDSYLVQRFEALRCALERPLVSVLEIGFALRNAGNGSQGATKGAVHARNDARRTQRKPGELFAAAMSHHIRNKSDPDWDFCVVVLTRIAPRMLDGPNLDHAFKSVIDGFAHGVGIDDSNPCVRYVTNQEKGRESRVRCELFIEPRNAE